MKQEVFFEEINGVKCYIIPKKDFVEKKAMIAVNYGSVDNSFSIDGKQYNMPCGIAHFLEHKLFEKPDFNVFDSFGRLGASLNAFTNFTTTAYYFNCIDNFEEALKLLLEMLSSVYFTEENVEKEKDIIEQEIKMYDDDAMWSVYFNMLDCMFHNIPVKTSIAGSCKDIKMINKDMLDMCYKAFYTNNNTAVICSGDFNRDRIYRAVEKNLKLNVESKAEKSLYDEPYEVLRKEIDKKMEINRTIFNLGFKETDFSDKIVKRTCITKIFLDILAGNSSESFEKMYSSGIIDESFGFDYLNGSNYGCALFTGFSERPAAVCDCILETAEQLKHQGICRERFERIKNKHIGRFIKHFDSINAAAALQADLFSKGMELRDMLECYESIEYDDINNRLYSLELENSVLSSVSPKNEAVRAR